MENGACKCKIEVLKMRSMFFSFIFFVYTLLFWSLVQKSPYVALYTILPSFTTSHTYTTIAKEASLFVCRPPWLNFTSLGQMLSTCVRYLVSKYNYWTRFKSFYIFNSRAIMIHLQETLRCPRHWSFSSTQGLSIGVTTGGDTFPLQIL